MLTDSHAHLVPEFQQDNLLAMLDGAALAGVHRIVAIGCDLASSKASLELAESDPRIWATVGIHPGYVTSETAPDWLEQLRSMARHPKCVGIGEIGLDYYHAAPEGWSWEQYLARQEEFFLPQLELAAACGKNVVIHQRDRSGTPCWTRIKELVQPWETRLRAVFHCWLHSWEEAAPMVAKGHLISFTGIVTYKNAPVAARCATEAPAGTFMLETDSPYLAPVPHRGKRNQPAYLRETAAAIAVLRGQSLEDVAALTESTAQDFFHFGGDTCEISPPPAGDAAHAGPSDPPGAAIYS